MSVDVKAHLKASAVFAAWVIWLYAVARLKELDIQLARLRAGTLVSYKEWV